MIAKRKDLDQLRREYMQARRVNSAPGALISRTTRGTFVKPTAKNLAGGGSTKGAAAKWG